jgi:hypothetical protein
MSFSPSERTYEVTRVELTLELSHAGVIRAFEALLGKRWRAATQAGDR